MILEVRVKKSKKMSRKKAIVLAIFTAWPFLWTLIAMGTIYGMLMSDLIRENESFAPFVFMLIMLPIHLLTMVDIIILLIIYLGDVFKTERILKDKKVLWGIALFMGNILAMPIYWYLYIWKKEKYPNNKNSGNGVPPLSVRR